MSGDVEIFFYSSLSEQQLYALRLGKWYRLSMPRSREVLGPEAVEHILTQAPGEISTSMSRDEWKYLLPKEVPYSGHGPDETAHYRNPRRRKNSGKIKVGDKVWLNAKGRNAAGHRTPRQVEYALYEPWEVLSIQKGWPDLGVPDSLIVSGWSTYKKAGHWVKYALPMSHFQLSESKDPSHRKRQKMTDEEHYEDEWHRWMSKNPRKRSPEVTKRKRAEAAKRDRWKATQRKKAKAIPYPAKIGSFVYRGPSEVYPGDDRYHDYYSRLQDRTMTLRKTVKSWSPQRRTAYVVSVELRVRDGWRAIEFPSFAALRKAVAIDDRAEREEGFGGDYLER